MQIDGTMFHGWLLLLSALFTQGVTPTCGAQATTLVAASRFISSLWFALFRAAAGNRSHSAGRGRSLRYDRRVAARLRVAIVGDGIIGWSTAFELARRGVDVAIYRGSTSGAATPASAGILAPYTEAHPGSALLDFTVRG